LFGLRRNDGRRRRGAGDRLVDRRRDALLDRRGSRLRNLGGRRSGRLRRLGRRRRDAGRNWRRACRRGRGRNRDGRWSWRWRGLWSRDGRDRLLDWRRSRRRDLFRRLGGARRRFDGRRRLRRRDRFSLHRRRIGRGRRRSVGLLFGRAFFVRFAHRNTPIKVEELAQSDYRRALTLCFIVANSGTRRFGEQVACEARGAARSS